MEHYDAKMNPPGLDPVKSKSEVTNVSVGREVKLLHVKQNVEPVPKPVDMTRQVPRYNETGVYNLGKPFRVAKLTQNNQHVPLRKPAVVHGVNALANSQAGVITGTAEFFGKQSQVKGLKDTLNEDPLDYITRDMTRIEKATATDVVDIRSGLHNTAVRRTRARKPAEGYL